MGNNHGILKGVETDWQKYAGVWYERARIPSWFEKSDDGDVSALYVPVEGKPNQFRIENRSTNLKTNRTNTAVGTATIDASKPGVLQVNFSWLQPKSAYIVLARGNDYEWSLVGSKNRKLLWLLMRDQTAIPSAEFLAKMVGIAEQYGYTNDTLKDFERTPLTPAAPLAPVAPLAPSVTLNTPLSANNL